MRSVTPSEQSFPDESRRLDSHQHHSAYKADAFLFRATSASKLPVTKTGSVIIAIGPIPRSRMNGFRSKLIFVLSGETERKSGHV